MKKRLLMAAAAAAMLIGLAGPAAAHEGEEPPAKCNSGRGNGSETVPANDCDPGNSGGHNNGGD